MRRLVEILGVALLFFAGALAITLVCATALFGVPLADLPGVALLLLGAGGGVGLAALLLLRPAVLARLGGVRGHLVAQASSAASCCSGWCSPVRARCSSPSTTAPSC